MDGIFTQTTPVHMEGKAFSVEELRVEGATWGNIAALIRVKHRVNALIAFRLAHGWTRQQAALAYTRRWPNDEKIAENVRLWENWTNSSGYVPTPLIWQRLAELYQCAVSDLMEGIGDFRHLDENWARRQES